MYAQDGYKIIVNKQNEIKTLTLEDLYKIFTGKKTTWENGAKIKLIIQKNGEYHREFILDVTKMKSVKFAQLWKKKIFTGRASHLRIADKD
jgi:ABC-type phosphate transport system substrate-binding protein